MRSVAQRLLLLATDSAVETIQILARLSHQQHAFGFSIREGFDIDHGGVAIAKADSLADVSVQRFALSLLAYAMAASSRSLILFRKLAL